VNKSRGRQYKRTNIKRHNKRKTTARRKGNNRTHRAKMQKTQSAQLEPEPEPAGKLSPVQQSELERQMGSLKFQPKRIASQVKIMEQLGGMNILDWIIFSKWCAVFISGDVNREYEGNGEVGKAYDIFTDKLDEHSDGNTYPDMDAAVDGLWPIRSWGTEPEGKVYRHAYLKSKNPARRHRKVKFPAWAQAVVRKLKGQIMRNPGAKAAYDVFQSIHSQRSEGDIRALLQKQSFKSKLKKLDIRPNSLLYGDGILNLNIWGDDEEPQKMGFIEMAFTPIILPFAMAAFAQMVGTTSR
jgi:hypothetical protein